MTGFVTGLRQVIEDFRAPDLKAILSLQKQLEVERDARLRRIAAFRGGTRSEFCPPARQ